MRDYIKIPTWIDPSMMKSNLLDFYLEKGNIDLGRKNYIKNAGDDKSLVYELKLRGFQFKINRYGTTMIKNKLYFKTLLLYTDKDRGSFKNIDYNYLGLPNLNTLFNIESDFFFNYIPIENFNLFNQDLNEDKLIEEFTKNGFKVTSISNLYQINLENIDSFIIKNKDQLAHIKIEDLFYEENFKDFKLYLLEKDIEYLSQLKQLDLNAYYENNPKSRGSIRERILFVVGLLDHYGKNQKYRTFKENLPLYKIFYEEEFEDFLAFLERKDIYNLGQYSMKALKTSLSKYRIYCDEIEDRTQLIYKVLNINFKARSSYKDLKISSILESEKYRKLVEFLKKEGISTFEQLLNQKLDYILEGSYIRQDIKDEFTILLKVYKNIYVIFEEKELLEERDSLLILTGLNNLKIKDIYNLNKDKILSDYIKDLSKTYMEELYLKDFNSLRDEAGVGRVKIKNVENTLVSYKNIKAGILANKDPEIINKYFSLDSQYRIEDLKYGHELLLDTINVETVFIDGKYSLILDYFKENKIETINDIGNKDILNIKNIKGIGDKKFNDFLDKLRKLIKDEISGFDLSNYKEELRVYSKLEINQGLAYLNLPPINLNIRLDDLNSENFSNFQVEEQASILLLLKYLHEFKGLNHILRDIFKDYGERDLYILYMRYTEALTLQEVGENLNLSRERVRQLENNIIDNINLNLKKNNFHLYLKFIFNTNEAFKLESLNQKLRRENRFLSRLIEKDLIDDLYYFPAISMVYFKNIDGKKEDLEKFISKLPDINTREYYLEELEKFVYDSFSLELSLEESMRVFKYYGFHFNKSYMSKNKLHYSDMLYILFKEVFTRPQRVDKNTEDFINGKIASYFGSDKAKDERNIRAILDRFDDILLYESKTYSHIDYLNNDLDLMDRIRKFIDAYLEENSIVNTELIFKHFEKDCLRAGIDNKIYLYSLIKYNFSDIYSIGQGNTLSIKSLDQDKHITKEEVLMEFIDKSKDIKVKKEEVIDKLGWNRVNLENTLVKCRKIISFENDYIANIDMLFQNGERDFLLDLAEKKMAKGYSTTYVLYEELMKTSKGKRFLERNRIRQHSTLSNIFKNLDPNIQGHINLLYYEDSKVKGIEDLINEYIDGVSKREDIQKFLAEQGYKSGMIGLHLKNMIREGKLKEISSNKLIKEEDFIIDEEIGNKLKTLVLELMGDRSFIGLTEENMEFIKGKMPDIGYNWTPHLVRSILESKGFKRIERRNCDYRYELVILLKADSKVDSFEELVYSILKTENKSSLKEEEVYEYLVDLNLIQANESRDKKLPYEIETSKMFKIDNKGEIYI